MRDGSAEFEAETIRSFLRNATRDAHDALDARMSTLDLANPHDYATFLRVQLSARRALEGWVEQNLHVDEHPPRQTGLIEADLAAMDEHLPAVLTEEFEARAEGALGVAWTLAGSSMGNRAMLAGLRKRGARVPTAFLSGEAMPAFFTRLRSSLDAPCPSGVAAEAMRDAALAVFAQFIRAADAEEVPALKAAA